jgi:DNA-binding response OmpR family regulator
MIENILVIDEPTIWIWHKKFLERELNCKVDVVWYTDEAKELLDTRAYNLVIIEPYTVEPEGSYPRGEFVKNDLQKRKIPFIVSSEANQEELLTFARLKAGEDYQEYLRKPYRPRELSEKIAKLFGERK